MLRKLGGSFVRLFEKKGFLCVGKERGSFIWKEVRSFVRSFRLGREKKRGVRFAPDRRWVGGKEFWRFIRVGKYWKILEKRFVHVEKRMIVLERKEVPSFGKRFGRFGKKFRLA